MRFFKSMLAALLLCLLLSCAALGESAGALTPMERSPEADGQVLDLYCGPTQGFYRHGGQTLDTGKPYVLFGQYDCWAMAAQGTAESFGPVGWVEADRSRTSLTSRSLALRTALPPWSRRLHL